MEVKINLHVIYREQKQSVDTNPKGGNLFDFLFTLLYTEPDLERGLRLKEFTPQVATSFILE